jgi:GNAT superfamily N-acetyltransferase
MTLADHPNSTITVAHDLVCVVTRELMPSDRQALLDLFTRSSPRTRRERFHVSLSVMPQRYLDDIISGRQTALTAREICDGANVGKIFGLASAATVRPGSVEFAVWVDDAWQRKGVGALLTRTLLGELSAQGVQTAIGYVEPDNHSVRRLIDRVAPCHTSRYDDGILVVEIPLEHWTVER